MSNYVIGIDTGSKGAMSLFRDGEPIEVVDIPNMPTRDKKLIVDARGLFNIIGNWCVLCDAQPKVIIEDVHAMPKQGVTSSFNFGMSKGLIVGVVVASNLGFEYVSPNKWKKMFKLSGTEKDFARTAAIQRWPHMHKDLKRKKDIDRADALWIGLSGYK